MSPHGEQQVEQEVVNRPAKLKLEQPDDTVDVKGIQWRPPNVEVRKQRVEDQLKNARDLVEARIKTGADMVEFRNRLLDQLQELTHLGHDLVKQKQQTLLKENVQERKILEEELRTISLFDGRQQALAELASGDDIQSLIRKAKQRQNELNEEMEPMEDFEAEIFGAKKLNPHNRYLDVLMQIQKNPDSVSEMREKQHHLLEARLKYTGSVGGSHDVETSMDVLLKKTGSVGGTHEVITKMGEPSNESVEARQQMLLEKKWMILRQEQQDTEADYAGLGFLQKLFGEKGRMLKTKLARIKSDQERVYKQILPARQRKLGTEFEAMAQAMRKE